MPGKTMKAEKPHRQAPFVQVAGMKLVYEPPRRTDQPRKHACPDCHFCQFCSDARCHSCREKELQPVHSLDRKLNPYEQAGLYEEVNARFEKQTECEVNG